MSRLERQRGEPGAQSALRRKTLSLCGGEHLPRCTSAGQEHWSLCVASCHPTSCFWTKDNSKVVLVPRSLGPRVMVEDDATCAASEAEERALPTVWKQCVGTLFSVRA